MQDINLLLSQPDDKLKRVCASCTAPCACSPPSTQCTCCCGPTCPDAPAQMSSEPDKFPIEHGILELVYRLAEMRIFEPCWSCEGHDNIRGIVIKTPQVWFYAASGTYPDLLVQHIRKLEAAKRLHATWQVQVDALGSNGATLYILKPHEDPGSTCPSLQKLRQDVRTIAENLGKSIRSISQNEAA